MENNGKIFFRRFRLKTHYFLSNHFELAQRKKKNSFSSNDSVTNIQTLEIAVKDDIKKKRITPLWPNTRKNVKL